MTVRESSHWDVLHSGLPWWNSSKKTKTKVKEMVCFAIPVALGMWTLPMQSMKVPGWVVKYYKKKRGAPFHKMLLECTSQAAFKEICGKPK